MSIGYAVPPKYLRFVGKSKGKSLKPEDRLETSDHISETEYDFIFQNDRRWTGQLLYFIQAGDSGPIKIGVSTLSNMKLRMASIQTSNAEKINVLAVLIVSNPQYLEENLHNYLSEHRMNGEWFRPDDRVLSFVGLAKAGRLDMIQALIDSKERRNA